MRGAAVLCVRTGVPRAPLGHSARRRRPVQPAGRRQRFSSPARPRPRDALPLRRGGRASGRRVGGRGCAALRREPVHPRRVPAGTPPSPIHPLPCFLDDSSPACPIPAYGCAAKRRVARRAPRTARPAAAAAGCGALRDGGPARGRRAPVAGARNPQAKCRAGARRDACRGPVAVGLADGRL